MADKLKSSYELAMERLKGTNADAGTHEPLTAAQKEKIAEARRVAAARRAELEMHFNDPKRRRDPAEQEKAEAEYQTDRRRVDEDLERAIAEIRRRP